MSDSVVKTRNVGERTEVVGRQAESFSMEGVVRNLQRLAAANHGWAQHPVKKRSWVSTGARWTHSRPGRLLPDPVPAASKSSPGC